MPLATFLKPTFPKVIFSVICGIVLFLVLSSSCAHGFPDGQPVFPCDTDFSRNIVILLFGCFFLGYPLIYFTSLVSIKKLAVAKVGLNKYVYGGLISGLISGLLSFYLVYLSAAVLVMAPGIIFSFIIGLFFFFYKKIKSLIHLLMFITLATIGYTVAYFVAISLGFFAIGNPSAFVVIPVTAGGIGSFLLLRGFHYFICPLTSKQFIFLIFFGCLLSLSTYIIPDGMLFKPDTQVAAFPVNWLFSLFIFWQAGMAAALGGTAFAAKIPTK